MKFNNIITKEIQKTNKINRIYFIILFILIFLIFILLWYLYLLKKEIRITKKQNNKLISQNKQLQTIKQKIERNSKNLNWILFSVETKKCLILSNKKIQKILKDKQNLNKIKEKWDKLFIIEEEKDLKKYK